jgi:hypothetical protein
MMLCHRVIQTVPKGGRCRTGLRWGSGQAGGDVDQVTLQGCPARGRAQKLCAIPAPFIPIDSIDAEQSRPA